MAKEEKMARNKIYFVIQRFSGISFHFSLVRGRILVLKASQLLLPISSLRLQQEKYFRQLNLWPTRPHKRFENNIVRDNTL